MSIYRVIFTWKGKELELKARSLDLTHPYFVSIKDLIFPEGPKLIINPAEDELLKSFGKSKHIMIPFQTVHLIEELMDEEAQPSKVRTFKVIEGEKSKKEAKGKAIPGGNPSGKVRSKKAISPIEPSSASKAPSASTRRKKNSSTGEDPR